MEIYEQDCESYNADSEDVDNTPTAGPAADKHPNNIDSVWEQTSDLHTELLVSYHRVCLRQAGPSIISKYLPSASLSDYLRNRRYVLQMFILFFFVFSVRHKNTRQPFSGTDFPETFNK